jgi:hypothetical protein
MAKTQAEIEAIRDRIIEMPLSDQLRLCVELLDRGSYQHAEPIVRHVADALTAMRLFETLK